MVEVVDFKPKKDETAKYTISYNGGDEEEVEVTSFGVSGDNNSLIVFFDSEEVESPPFLLANINNIIKIKKVKE